jgi:hypothetical protein
MGGVKMSKAAAAVSLAAAGRSQLDACPASKTPSAGSAPNTLHIEYAVWSGTYRIIHTRPDGKRLVWRRGIESLEEARIRTQIVADICGYEAQL